jgi:hypothetical protein
MSDPNDHKADHHQQQPPTAGGNVAVKEPTASLSSSPPQSLYAMMPARPPPGAAATSTAASHIQQQPNMSMPPVMIMTAPPSLSTDNPKLIPPLMTNPHFGSINTEVSQEEFAQHKKRPNNTEEYYPFEEVMFQPIVTSPKVGDVVTILGSEEEDTTVNNMLLLPIYIRQHLVKKLKELKDEFEESTKLIRLYATGAAGCGKTCFFWMWAMMKMQHKANGCCWFSIVVPINRQFGFWKTTR